MAKTYCGWMICAAALAIGTCGVEAGPSYNVAHSFVGTDGANPVGGVSFDSAGNMYGTTQLGGANNMGTVFSIAPNGTQTVLHSFAGSDGKWPMAGVTIVSKTGDLYGTTYEGGSNQDGVLWHIGSDGKFHVAHTFAQNTDGIYVRGLIADGKGNLYGTAEDGGSGGYGTVYELTSRGRFQVLYNFTGHADGGVPRGGLVRDHAGNLYGTTVGGGTDDEGTIFVVGGGIETVLYNFTGGNDGSGPSGALLLDKNGNLYGTAFSGGEHGDGTVFELLSGGTFNVLHSFAGGTDGMFPQGNLLLIGRYLYGATGYGGASCNCGTVYSLRLGRNRVQILHDFLGATSSDGSRPAAGLALGGDGLLYGTTSLGGGYDDGTVFSISTK